MSPASLTRGVTYVCFGDSFREEAARSIASLRRASPGLAIAAITDAAWSGEGAPDIVVERPAVDGFACKPTYIYEDTPFERTLFIDTGTLVVRDLEPVFELLDLFDVGVRRSDPLLAAALVLRRACNDVRRGLRRLLGS